MSLVKKVWQDIYNWMGVESTQETLMDLGAWKIKQGKEQRNPYLLILVGLQQLNLIISL